MVIPEVVHTHCVQASTRCHGPAASHPGQHRLEVSAPRQVPQAWDEPRQRNIRCHLSGACTLVRWAFAVHTCMHAESVCPQVLQPLLLPWSCVPLRSLINVGPIVIPGAAPPHCHQGTLGFHRSLLLPGLHPFPHNSTSERSRRSVWNPGCRAYQSRATPPSHPIPRPSPTRPAKEPLPLPKLQSSTLIPERATALSPPHPDLAPSAEAPP